MIDVPEPMICIVENCPDMLLTLAAMLGTEGFRSRVFSSGDEFLSSPAFHEGQCVFLDYHMPGKHDGLAVLEQMSLKHDPRPVILLTSDTDPTLRRTALAAGAMAVLIKARSIEELCHYARKGVHRYQEEMARRGGRAQPLRATG